MNLAPLFNYRNLNRNLYKVLVTGCMFIIVFLFGCSEQNQSVPLSQNDVIQYNVDEMTKSAKTGTFIQPTIIPSDNSQRRELLKQLAITPSSSFIDKRLALFTRYTLLVNGENPELDDLNKIIDELHKLADDNKRDVELSALLGSATSFQSVFYAEDSGKQRLLSKKGGRLMDRAIKDSPNHLGVRLQRGISYASMPAFLGKARYAVDDLTLIKNVANNNDFDFDAMIDYYLGMAMLKNKQPAQGIKILEQLVSKKLQPWSQHASYLIKENS